MKKNLCLVFVMLVAVSAAFSQKIKTADDKSAVKKTGNMSKIRGRKPPEYDNASIADARSGILKRGAEIGTARKASLADVLKKPEAFAGKAFQVEGVIVRSCKTEGCWMELAPDAESAKSVRVTFRNHAFFIPLDAAGMRARAEGVFSIKTLSKEQVEHLKNEDGAKFDNINADGTVTEISFEATGVQLTKQKDSK